MLPRLIPIQQEMAKCFWAALLLISISLAGPFAFAAPKASAKTPKELTPDAIFKLYKDAVVRIEVSLHGAPLGVGSGFFVTNSGEIATSLHVVRPFLVHPETEMRIKLANGKVFRSAKFGACSDSRGVDLCLLKIDVNPKSLLPLAPVDVTPGESIVAIGHPRGLDFSISTGVVSALRTHPAGWNEVQIDAAISPGNSGGPIINRKGQAIGVVYQFERDGQNLNFGILTPEIQKLRALHLPYLPTSEARKDFLERSKRVARRASDHLVKPAIESFQEAKTRPSGLKWMRAQFGETGFVMLLPDLFLNCERADEQDGAMATTCASSGGDLLVTVQKRPRSLPGSLTGYRGRRLVETRALSIVDSLESEGTWEDIKPKQASFMSRPSAARCAALSTAVGNGGVRKTVANSDGTSLLSLRKNAFFSGASALCRFETENDAEAGAVSVSQWIEFGRDFYGINVWSADPGRIAFLQSLSDLILVSAGTSSDEAQLPYRVKLWPGLKRDDAVTPTIAGADINDSYSDGASSLTIARTPPVTPAQMNRSFNKWVAAVARSTGPLKGDVTSLEVANRPTRLGTWVIPHPTVRGRNLLLLMSATFDSDATWILYETKLLPTPQESQRRPSNSITTDMERFRDLVEDFQPTTR